MINDDFWTTSTGRYWEIGDASNDDIVAESVKMTETIWGGNMVTIGCCIPSMLTFKTMPGVVLSSSNVSVSVKDSPDAEEAFVVGRFLIDSKERNSDGTTQYTAYSLDKSMMDDDFTKWYKNEFPTSKSKKTVTQFWNDLRTSRVFTARGLTGEASPDFANPNFEIYGNPDISYIDGQTIITDLCELNGVNAHVDRDHCLRFISLPLGTVEPVKTYTNADIIPPATIKEGTTPKFNNIKVLDSENREIYTYGYVYGETPCKYIVKDNVLLYKKKAADLTAAITNLYNKIRGCEIGTAKLNTLPDLAVEVGDVVRVPDGNDYKDIIVVNRTFSGTSNCKDTISCELNVTENTSGNGSENNTQYGGESEADELYDLFGNVVDLPEVIRNVGFRLLDEPSNVNVTFDKATNTVSMTWNDPDDISADEPSATEYAGTVIVRKQGSRPLNRWDGTVIDEYGASDKDKYASTPLTDTVDSNTGYYYGIFPYDDDGIVKHYRWTCTFGINTDLEVDGASITSATADGRSVTVEYTLPSGNYTNKLVYKANGIPQSISDGTAVNITGTSYTVPNLTATTKYGFIIFSTDSNNRTAVSNAISCTTGTVSTTVLFDVHDADTFTHACTQSPSTTGTGLNISWDSANGRTKVQGNTSGVKYWDAPSPYNAVTVPDADVFFEMEAMAEQYDRFPMQFHWGSFNFTPNGYAYDTAGDAKYRTVQINDTPYESRSEVNLIGAEYLNQSYNTWRKFRVEFKVRNGKFADGIKVYVDNTLVINSTAANGRNAPKPFGNGDLNNYGQYNDNYFNFTHSVYHHARNIKMWYEA